MTDLSFAKTFLSTLDNKPTKYQSNHIFDPETFGVRIPFVLPKLPHPPHPLPPKESDVSADTTDTSTTPTTTVNPGSEKSNTTTNTITVTLKSARNPNMTLTLPSLAPSTTLASLKQQVHTYLGGGNVVNIDKIKILLNKKPVPSSKQTVSDTIEDPAQQREIEYGVMVIGGAPDPPAQVAAGPGSENAAMEAETGVNPASVSVSASVPMDGVEKSRSRLFSQTNPPVQPGEVAGKEVLQTKEFWDDLEGFLAQRLRDQEEAVRLRDVFKRAVG